MMKQKYITPQIFVRVMNVAPVMNTVSIPGEPTGQGNHGISGAKSSYYYYDDDYID